jgi:hypothetical protein
LIADVICLFVADGFCQQQRTFFRAERRNLYPAFRFRLRRVFEQNEIQLFSIKLNGFVVIRND